MKRTIRFRLNERLYELPVRDEALALDWIRNEAGLKGTKEGCREGDCGACLVMFGGRDAAGQVEWQTVTSCTLAMGELDGRHIITIEGLASTGLTPVMEAMLDHGASQCGFCSPGFILALTAYLVSGSKIDAVAAMTAVEGNLCRCTGYGSIRRAAARLADEFSTLPQGLAPRLQILSQRGVLPPSLAALMSDPPAPVGRPAPSQNGSQVGTQAGTGNPATPANAPVHAPSIGGGTDYFVRNPDPDEGLSLYFTGSEPEARAIGTRELDGKRYVSLGAGVTATDFFNSPAVQAIAPGIERFERDIASPPIRNRATLAGNIANASPIADMTAILIALDARLELRTAGTEGPAAGTAANPGGKENIRYVDLPEFFLGYKKLDLKPGERIGAILIPARPVLFNFEKAAKRVRLDIATVNSAAAFTLGPDGAITAARYAAGGIAPVPLRVREIEAALIGKKPSAALAREIGSLAMKSGAPIGDVRGSSAYRRRLMERFAWAHFIRLWPQLKLEEELFK
ncbi:MAG: FAD binding domain-containing protein [Spirochaetia bacterium]|nr:FAD binding domain-containing protein [Spirochaetia bacterium]